MIFLFWVGGEKKKDQTIKEWLGRKPVSLTKIF